MSAINQTETQAIDTATAVTDTPAQNLISVPLSQLRASKRNVRKTKSAGQSIDALAASFARVGLLQNLTVTLARNGEHYEVVAGGRRLAALKLLAKTRRIPKDWAVPCLLVADASARTVSLTENVQREAMHPADQFEAFVALAAEGRPIEDIAADFSVTPLVVQRRLKLANVSPRLLADYRADAVNLEQLMALAITDDHTAQDAAYYDAPQWQRSPHALRERLTEREIDAGHALVRFVGLDAYEAAGGGICRDLFAQDDTDVYVTDAALLETDPGNVRANAYDIVLNGNEIGGGSIRIHDRAMQKRMFEILGFSDEEAQKQFGFLMNAFEFGAPPHGGIAFGFDRFVALLGGDEVIRDYIAFPKNNSGRDVMIDAPASISAEQLKELFLKVTV